MQQIPLLASSLMDLRRKPLGDISNKSATRLSMLEAEKKIAESLVATTVTQKEILRLQTIKTVGLLKEQLAKTELTLSIANNKISALEKQRISDKETLTENDLMTERLFEMENEIVSATQEHETIVLSMHFEREQFATRLFDLESKLSDVSRESAASAHDRDAEAVSRNDIQNESSQMCLTLQASAEQCLLSEENLMKRITLLKSKLGSKFREEAGSRKEIKVLNADLATTHSLLEIQKEVILKSTALAAEKEMLLQDTIKAVALMDEREHALQETVSELRAHAEKNTEEIFTAQQTISELRITVEMTREDLVRAKESVRQYKTQIDALQIELHVKTSESMGLQTSASLRMSSLNNLLEGEKGRVILLEKRLGDLDEAAQREIDEWQEEVRATTDTCCSDISSMRMVVAELNEKVSAATLQLSEGREHTARLQVALVSAESSAVLRDSAQRESESEYETRICGYISEIEILKLQLTDSETVVSNLTTTLKVYEVECKRLSLELTSMVEEKQLISEAMVRGREEMLIDHNHQLSAMTELIKDSTLAQRDLSVKALALESAESVKTSELQELMLTVQSYKEEILSLEISKSNMENSTEFKCESYLMKIGEKSAQIDELNKKLSSAYIYQQAAGKELSGVVEEIVMAKENMALKIQELEAAVAGYAEEIIDREKQVARQAAELSEVSERAVRGESTVLMISEEVATLTAELEATRADLKVKAEDSAKSSEDNFLLFDKCLTLKQKVSNLKADVQHITKKAEEERQKWTEESSVCRKREEVQATTADDLLNTMNRLKEEVWGAFKTKLADKEREIQGLMVQIEDAHRLRAEAEEKTLETVRSLTAAHEKCNTFQDMHAIAEERHGTTQDEVRALHARDMTKLQTDLGERLRAAEMANDDISVILAELQTQKSASDEKLEIAMREISLASAEKLIRMEELKTLLEENAELENALQKGCQDSSHSIVEFGEKINNLNMELGSKTEEVAWSVAKISELELLLIDLTEEKNSLTEKLRIQARECEDVALFNERILNLEQEVFIAQAHVRSTQSELDITKEALAAEVENISFLEQQIESLKVSAREQSDLDKDLIETLKSDSQAARSRAIENSATEEASSREITLTLESRVSDLERNTTELEFSLSTSADKVVSLTAVVEAQAASIAESSKEIAAVTAESADKIKALTMTLTESQLSVSALAGTLKGSDETLCIVTAQLQMVTDRMTAQGLQLEQAAEKITSQQAESVEAISSLTAALADSRSEVQNLSGSVGELSTAMAVSEIQIAVLERTVEEHKCRIASATAESVRTADVLSASLTASQASVSALSDALKGCEERAHSLASQLEASAVTNSSLTSALQEAEQGSADSIAQLIGSLSDADATHRDELEEHAALIAYLQLELDVAKAKSISLSSPMGTKSKKNIISSDNSPKSPTPVPVFSGNQPVQVLPQKVCSDREFSHMQREMKRFRYARDEAKVSMSKMAGRVAILKDQLQGNAIIVETASNQVRENELRRLEESAKMREIKGSLCSVTAERDELLSQVIDLEISIVQVKSPSSAGPKERKGLHFISPMMSSPDSISHGRQRRIREREEVGDDRNSILACVPFEECSEEICDVSYCAVRTEQPVQKTPDHSNVKNLISATAIDIDFELRSRLKAIRMEGEGVEVLSMGGSVDRKTQLLTSRLDALQRELDLKNKTLSHYDAMQVEMDRKKEENKSLKGRVLGLEQTTVILQQELSVMRSLQKEEKKITPPKSAGSIKLRSPFESKKIPYPIGLKSVEKRREKVSPKQGGSSAAKPLQARSTPSAGDVCRSNKLLSVFERETLLESGPCTPALSHGDGDAMSVPENKENVANRLGVCE